MTKDEGEYVLPGDTMEDPAHKGLIYKHEEPPCFVTWDEALKRVMSFAPDEQEKKRAKEQAWERAKQEQERAEAMLTSLRFFVKRNPLFSQALHAWHEARDYECCAHSEGQGCCIDELLGSTEPSA